MKEGGYGRPLPPAIVRVITKINSVMDRMKILKAEADAMSKDNGTPDFFEPNVPSVSSAIRILTAVHIILGMVCIIVGIVVGIDSYFNKAAYIVGGIVVGVFCFTLAVVTATCAKILRK